MQNNRLGLIAIVILLIMIFSVILPAANALTPRDISIIKDRITTDRYPGGQRVCGDQLCTASEWAEMKHALQVHIHKSMTCEELKKWKVCKLELTKPQSKSGKQSKTMNLS